MFNALLGTKITLAGDFVCLLLPSHKWNFIHVLSMILCCCCLFVWLGEDWEKWMGKWELTKQILLTSTKTAKTLLISLVKRFFVGYRGKGVNSLPAKSSMLRLTGGYPIDDSSVNLAMSALISDGPSRCSCSWRTLTVSWRGPLHSADMFHCSVKARHLLGRCS